MKIQIYEGGFNYTSIDVESIEEALLFAKENVERTNYNGCSGTLWIDVKVVCEETGAEETDTVTLHEEAPTCTEDEHNFQQSYKLFGGCKENPGVWGHGGGVIIHTVCIHCGCKSTLDTWAQRPDTGEQGLESISYEELAFSSEELQNI